MAQCVIIKEEESNRNKRMSLPRDLMDSITEENLKLIKNKKRITERFEERISQYYPMLNVNSSRKENINYINSRR